MKEASVRKMEISHKKEILSEFTNERNEGVKIAVSSCISKRESIQTSVNRKSCKEGTRKGLRHANRKFLGAGNIKAAIIDN